MIDLLPESEAARETWQAVIDLARHRPDGWTLIGAQMVVLHGLERGRLLPRLTADADVLVDVRLVASGIREVSSDLVGAGFELSDPDPFGVAHRFRRGKATLDVLAPDGLGKRSDLTTVPPCRTIRCPGGSQALRRSERTEVRLGGETVAIPRPNLLGAILIKARAVFGERPCRGPAPGSGLPANPPERSPCGLE
ncbi:MAG: hypothetical protein ACRD2Z_10975 [Thermoanaerobaculia bacterium]